MKEYETILNDIKTIKIQGAENVAKQSIYALHLFSKDLDQKTFSFKKTIKELREFSNKIISIRPTEPALRNCINYLLNKLEKENKNKKIKEFKNLLEIIDNETKKIFSFFDDSDEIIAEIGSRKIKNGMIIYTHCHSSTVMNILKKAKAKNKNFKVHLTETRPHFQGRISAKELANCNIDVTYYVDSAMRLAMKKADMMLIGADAITNEGKAINKIGSELAATIAKEFAVSLYICTNSWKYDPKTIFGYDTLIEERKKEDIWVNSPENIKINTLIFEKINSKLIDGYITELGIFDPNNLFEEISRAYPWITKLDRKI
jgi:ribose 1,5-bisphosphate isomerase